MTPEPENPQNHPKKMRSVMTVANKFLTYEVNVWNQDDQFSDIFSLT